MLMMSRSDESGERVKVLSEVEGGRAGALWARGAKEAVNTTKRATNEAHVCLAIAGGSVDASWPRAVARWKSLEWGRKGERRYAHKVLKKTRNGRQCPGSDVETSQAMSRTMSGSALLLAMS